MDNRFDNCFWCARRFRLRVSGRHATILLLRPAEMPTSAHVAGMEKSSSEERALSIVED